MCVCVCVCVCVCAVRKQFESCSKSADPVEHLKIVNDKQRLIINACIVLLGN